MARVLMVFKAPDGGAAENVVQLARGLGSLGWEVELAGPLQASVYERVPARLAVHRLPIAPGYRALRANAAALLGLRRLLRARRYDVVHAHSAVAGVLARLARGSSGGRRRGTAAAPPVVYTPHCFPFLGNSGRMRAAAGLAIERGLTGLTAAYIDVSDYERVGALARGVGPAHRHHVVRNACEDCPGIEPEPRLARLRGDGPLVLLISALRAQKRVEVFLRALPGVLEAVPAARAAVVGNGPEQGRLRELADTLGLGQDGRFAMLSFEGPAARYLRSADVYVLCSGWESMPIGVLEALACGVPQVAGDVGGVAEAVDDGTGVLVAPGDPPALAGALVELLGDPARRERMAARSRAVHARRFNLDRMLAETAAVYAGVLAGS